MTPSVERVLWALALTLIADPGSGQIRFEVAADWGIDFTHQNGASGAFYMPETMGSGVAIFDYDSDGDQDVLLLSSGPMPGFNGSPVASTLFRNDRSGFIAVTAGLDIADYAMGVTAGDVDNDGNPDLYITAFGRNQLFVGTGNGSFEERNFAHTVESSWSASASFDDLDLDGDLDLYVTRYVDFALDDNQICGIKERGLRSYCHPHVYRGIADTFFENLGQGVFADRSEHFGFTGARGNGLGVIFGDTDGDGLRDVYVANDMGPNFLFRSTRDQPATFEELALLSGAALSNDGTPEAGMGVDMGDLDGDGLEDLITTHLDGQTNAVYGNTPAGVFVDRRFVSRLAEPSLPKVGFGVSIADLDLDGFNDVLVANGHIIHNVGKYNRGTTFRQQNQVFRNLGQGVFEEETGAGLLVVESSRGSALGDLDGDGDLDVVINNSNARAEVYRNLQAGAGWLHVEPRGSGRYDVGARVTVSRGSVSWMKETRSASSYLSQSQSVASFGLGDREQIDTLQIRWSGGRTSRYHGLAGNRRIRIQEPDWRAEPSGRERH
ncbi:MAG: CRTAC1 family protein [Acidobacteriota bacterium]|nr:CRTAC1 family protein [Acidobacteriota bacterium]